MQGMYDIDGAGALEFIKEGSGYDIITELDLFFPIRIEIDFNVKLCLSILHNEEEVHPVCCPFCCHDPTPLWIAVCSVKLLLDRDCRIDSGYSVCFDTLVHILNMVDNNIN